MMSTVDIIAVIALTVTSLICITSNSLVCFAIYSRKTIKTMAKYYIFSLAITDILVGAVTVPYVIFLVALEHTGAKKYAMIYQVMATISCEASIMHLVIMSIDRVIAVKRPLYHRQITTKRRVLKMLPLPWIISISIGVCYCVIPSFGYFTLRGILLVGFFLIPLIVMITCYACIFAEIRRRNNSKEISVARIKERKLACTVLCVIVAFVVCWLPFHATGIYTFVHYLRGTTPAEIPWIFIMLLEYVNSACNPFIYAIFHPRFKSAFKGIFRDLVLKGICARPEKREVPSEERKTSSAVSILPLKSLSSKKTSDGKLAQGGLADEI